VLRLATSLADPAGGGGEVPTDCGLGHGPGPGSVCLVDHHHHPVQRSTGLPARRRHLHLRSAAGMNPRCERHSPRRPSPRLSRTPVTGSDKGAEASAAMVRRLIVCCDGTWNTTNGGVRGDPCPTNVNQTAGRSRRSTGRNATTLLLRGGVGVDRWERLGRGAFGFGFYCAG